MTTIKDQGSMISNLHPPPHDQYVVLREGRFFTATPCYGMHRPWWVVRLMNLDEADPLEMQDTDIWWPLSEFQAAVCVRGGEDAKP